MEEQGKKNTGPRCEDCFLACSGCTNWKQKRKAAQVTDTVGQMGFVCSGE